MNRLKITANVLFAGIGCQERGFENSGVVDLEVRAISEIDKDAVMSYSSIHKQLTPKMVEEYNGYPTEGEMIQELMSKNIGYDAKNGKAYDWNRFKKNREYIIKSNWLANHLSNNLGDISRIESLPEADLWTVSFPCQDISIAGYQNGFKEGTGTRSSLLWEQMRLLHKAVEDGTQPKFLLFENVKQIVGGEFRDDFLKLLDTLKRLGYRTQWKVLNAKDCGIPQNRERVFFVCIREDIEIERYTFPQPFHCDLKLVDILDLKVKKNKFLNKDRVKAIVERFREDSSHPKLDWKEKATDLETDILNVPDNTKDADSKVKNTYTAPKLTPKMCFLLMGLTEADLIKCREMGVSDTQLFSQAGNGIVTNCIQLLAEHLYKAVADASYVCTDEQMNGRALEDFDVFTVQQPKKSA